MERDELWEGWPKTWQFEIQKASQLFAVAQWIAIYQDKYEKEHCVTNNYEVKMKYICLSAYVY